MSQKTKVEYSIKWEPFNNYISLYVYRYNKYYDKYYSAVCITFDKDENKQFISKNVLLQVKVFKYLIKNKIVESLTKNPLIHYDCIVCDLKLTKGALLKLI